MEDINVVNSKASYCLNCINKPCSLKGCPLNNNIPNFIKCIKNEEYEEAYNVLCETTVLPAVCGRICPHQKQCEGSCIRGLNGEPVSIGKLEAFVGDIAIKEGYKIKTNVENKELLNKKVAVVGGGPAGLTCAAFLRKAGVQVTIYEKYSYLGGLLVHGIPEFRLSRKVITDTIKKIIDLGINVECNTQLVLNNLNKENIKERKHITLDELVNKNDAVFLSIGANVSSTLGVEGEKLNGVYGGNELLEFNIHPQYADKVVAVIGGGNVAMDCARTIKKMAAKEVLVIYRRSEKEMPAEVKEIADAKKEGIKFLFQNNIVKIHGEDKVRGIELIKTKLVKKEGEAREVPVNIENSNYVLDVDYVISAVGSKPDNALNNLGLKLNNYGNIEVNEKGQTSIENVFAGGNIIGYKSTVAWTARSGRETAYKIIDYLLKK